MKELIESLRRQNLTDARDKIENLCESITPLSDVKFSSALFRGEITPSNNIVVDSHLRSIQTQLNKVLNPTFELFKDDVLYLELCKGITTFDRVTQAIGLEGGTFGDNFVASQNLYLSAISSYRKYIPNFYQGDLDFSISPLKLRLAIEIYFKNMIGFVEAKSETLVGKHKGKISNYPLSISDLLRFFNDRRFRKYAKIPMPLSIIQDINYWSNNLVHTGIISYPWQTMTAIDFLKPLFYTARKDGSTHIEGFNYLDLSFEQESLVDDLSGFLSGRGKKVEVLCLKRTSRPLEGAYY